MRDIVSEVTDDKRLPKLERKRLQILHAKTSRLVRVWLSIKIYVEDVNNLVIEDHSTNTTLN